MKRLNPTRLLVAFFLLLWFGLNPLVELLVDLAWFDALDHRELFTTRLFAQVGLGVFGFLTSLLCLAVIWDRAARSAGREVVQLAARNSDVQLEPGQLHALMRLSLFGIAALLALAFGAGLSAQWLDVLAFFERQPFGTTDPIFGNDVGFYVFTLPVAELAQALLARIVLFALIGVGLLHLLRETARDLPAPAPSAADVLIFDPERQVRQAIETRDPSVTRKGRRQVLLLASAFFALKGVGYWLGRYDLLYSDIGVVFGPGYADIDARLPALAVMAVLSGGMAVLSAVFAFREGWRTPLQTAGGYAVAAVVLLGVWPGLVQKFYVTPNELAAEQPFLEHNIEATRQAWGLDRIEVKPFEVSTELTLSDIEQNPLTIQNVRLWDGRPLRETYSQLQEIRTYYEFVGLDVDRYEIDGKPRQTMLSPRELNYSAVPSQARSFINEHFQYTHGYGLTLSPVNVVTEEGLPKLWIQDLPPVSEVELEVTRPEIYYGELTDRWVLARTGLEEFDYPLGDKNKYTTYAGEGGVEIGSFFRKVLFSIYYGTLDIYLSDYIQPESRILFRRSVEQRVRELAPFLLFDSDPYMVIADDGSLQWLLDAYTYTDRYPYSERLAASARMNYVRNSVKVVVDAYNGDVTFYVADGEDPIVQAYQGIFPNSFEPLAAMPEDLRAHLRYPVDFFDWQAHMYRLYHMTDPTVFYNQEDLWQLPREQYDGQEQEMSSYYLIMKLPGEETEEFILLVPFVPARKDNMISWLAARCDEEHYGKLVLYQFPKQKLIYGPRQIEARIDQEPTISEQLTLWSQAGSTVARGNLLVIPVEDSLMYVEPLYLQAESSQLPELKRVIVAYENRIAMEKTLDEAISAVFRGAYQGVDPSGVDVDLDGEPPADWLPETWRMAVRTASEVFDAAEASQRAGDWAAYGEHLAELRAALRELAMEADDADDDARAADEGREGARPSPTPTPQDAP